MHSIRDRKLIIAVNGSVVCVGVGEGSNDSYEDGGR